MEYNDARKIVNALFRELGGRRGIGGELALIRDDTEVYNEMHHECVLRVMTITTMLLESPPQSSIWDPEHAGCRSRYIK